MDSYRYLADLFEELNDDCGYIEWTDYFLRGLSELHVGKTGLELGCGSGYFCRALSKRDFVMDGADLSLEMLTKAEYLSREEGVSCKFFQADASCLHVPKPYSFILSPNDCFNYVPQKKLNGAFAHVFRSLEKDGIFWFDISSAYKLRETIANNMFADDRENVTYLAFSHLKEDRVEMDVTLFERNQTGLFSRFDETHTLYIHEEEEVTRALVNAGFEIIRVEGKLGEEKTRSERLNFICRKQRVKFTKL